MTATHVLVTGSRFYSYSHIERIQVEAAATVTRFDPDDAPVGALAEALMEADGYLWGGFEIVRDVTISDSARLRAISFPGSGYKQYIPAWPALTARGVAIAAQVGMNATSVAEYAMSLTMAMLRVLPSAAEDEGREPLVFHEWSALTFAVIGLGHSGRAVAELASRLGMKVLGVTRNTSTSNLPANVRVVGLAEALVSADVVSVHANETPGRFVLTGADLMLMRRGALLVNVAFAQAVDPDALRALIESGNLRAAYDAVPKVLVGLAWPAFIGSRGHQVAYNTVESNRRIEDAAVTSLIHLLVTGDDHAVVNPEFKSFRQP